MSLGNSLVQGTCEDFSKANNNSNNNNIFILCNFMCSINLHTFCKCELSFPPSVLRQKEELIISLARFDTDRVGNDT